MYLSGKSSPSENLGRYLGDFDNFDDDWSWVNDANWETGGGGDEWVQDENGVWWDWTGNANTEILTEEWDKNGAYVGVVSDDDPTEMLDSESWELSADGFWWFQDQDGEWWKDTSSYFGNVGDDDPFTWKVEDWYVDNAGNWWFQDSRGAWVNFDKFNDLWENSRGTRGTPNLSKQTGGKSSGGGGGSGSPPGGTGQKPSQAPQKKTPKKLDPGKTPTFKAVSTSPVFYGYAALALIGVMFLMNQKKDRR